MKADTLKTKPRERITGVMKCRLYRFPPFVLSSYDIGILLSGCLSLMEWSRELLLLISKRGGIVWVYIDISF